MASSPAPVPAGPSQPRHRRICSAFQCDKRLCAESGDPHTLCVGCRGGICSLDKRCRECEDWEDELILKASKHQLSLRSRRLAYHKGKVGGKSVPLLSPSSSVPSVLDSNMAATTADDSARSTTSSPPSPGPSASQVDVSTNPQSQFSQVLNAMDKMASFLGITDNASPSCLKDVVKGIVRESLADELTNLISFPPPPDVPMLVVGDVGGGGESSGVHLTTTVAGGEEAPPCVNLDLVDSLRLQDVCIYEVTT